MPEGDEEEKQRLLIDGTNRVSQPATGSKFDDTSHPLGPGSSSSSSSSSSRSSSTTTKGSKSSRSSKKKEKQQVSQQAVDEGVGICRICLEEDDLSRLETPCSCSGTQRYAHHACIQRWIEEKGNKRCEICEQLYRGSFTVPPPQPPIPEDSPLGNGPSFPMFVVPAEVRLREALAQQARGFLDDEDDEGDLYSSRHPGLSWCFTFMVFFMFLVVLHHTLLVASSDDYDYDSSNGTEIEPGTQPSAPDQGYVADDDDLFTNATLFVLWVAAKALLIGIPLYIVMRIAARQAARERYEAMQMTQLGRGRIVLRFRNADPGGPHALMRPGIV